MTYPKFAARWQPSGGAERATHGLFLTGVCHLLGVTRPDAATDSHANASRAGRGSPGRRAGHGRPGSRPVPPHPRYAGAAATRYPHCPSAATPPRYLTPEDAYAAYQLEK